MYALFVATVLSGCSPVDAQPDPDDGGGETAEETPLDYRDAAPQWTAEEAVAELEGVFALGWPSPTAARAVFQELMAFGDAECPGNDLTFINTLDGCFSESGYWYMGLGEFAWTSTERNTDGAAYLEDALRTINGDFEILTPDGREYTSGGLMEMVRSTYSDHTAALTNVRGSWQWTGSDEGWFMAGTSSDLRTGAQTGGGSESLSFNGSYGVDHTYAYFDQLVMSSTCDWQTNGGVVTLRQDDASTTVLTFADDCSGCATVTWDGEDLGVACADWSAYGPVILAATMGVR
jgi:uncharacterized protein YceK